MRYKSFRIRNFKGIKDTSVSLETISGAAVFAFVGLNESGKTTILEAIHSFSPESATSELLGDEGTGVPFNERVPRHLISSFTGDVSVLATLSITEQDKERVKTYLAEKHSLEIDIKDFPDEISFERQQRFKDGDFKTNFFSLRHGVKVRSPKQRKWRDPKDEDERVQIRDAFYRYTPDIAYFPTFVFEFPDSIFLTNRGGPIDKFYRRVFQDILDYDNRGHTIDKDIIRRIRSEPMKVSWLEFLTSWMKSDDKDKIDHVMDRASSAVTRLVFGRWNKIFGENTKGKEVVISFETAEGKIKNAQGTEVTTNAHDLAIKFQIKDGTRRFNVNDRSLGFRWFFAFMLFTQFRVSRSSSRPLLFLFDEPASNLHAAAQQKLIDCFPEVAKGDHTLAYTTHSHYMIEPKWLEQTFIVTNRADAPIDSVLDAVSFDDESLDIKVSTYRSFVNDHPAQTSYFQPILDRLEVVPSRFDMQRASIVLEGKSDYYTLRYAAKFLQLRELPLLPGLGAGTFGALAALNVGWNLNFLFVLDGDHQGNLEKKRYVEEFGIPENCIVTISDFVADVKVIEDLLDENALEIIREKLSLNKTPTKAQIRRYFQECLASEEVVDLGSKFNKSTGEILTAMESRLA